LPEVGVIGTDEQKPWIVPSIGLVAEFFGVSRDTVRKDWKARGMPWNEGAFDLRAIMRWRREVELAQEDDDESGMVGPSSPNLERLRLAKAKMAETDLLEREGELIHRRSVQTFLARASATWRSITERLQRAFGPEAVEIVNGGLDGLEGDVETICGDSSDDCNSDEASHDSGVKAAPA